MPNCEKYQSLTPIEKISFIGELLHSAQSDNEIFELTREVVRLAIAKGIFDGVTINPIINDVISKHE